jgi:hypothetical protein
VSWNLFSKAIIRGYQGQVCRANSLASLPGVLKRSNIWAVLFQTAIEITHKKDGIIAVGNQLSVLFEACPKIVS